MNVTVLLSGGIDSAACLAFYLAQGHDVSAVHVDYGQLARLGEMRAARAVADHLRVPLEVISICNARRKTGGEIVGRNALLISLALLEVGAASELLAIGVHSGTPYFDCTPRFVEMMNQLTGFQTDGKVQIAAPFVEWTKRQIWDFAKNNRIPLSLTYSCESGGHAPCGDCPSCKDVRRLHAC